MSQQPTPEAIEAVARAITTAVDLDWDDALDQDAARDVASSTITAFLEYQRRHAPDTLAADLAAIVARLTRIEKQNATNADTFNTWAQKVDDNFAVMEANREKIDNVFELILKHLGVDMSGFGDPPRMTVEDIRAALRRRIEGVEG